MLVINKDKNKQAEILTCNNCRAIKEEFNVRMESEASMKEIGQICKNFMIRRVKPSTFAVQLIDTLNNYYAKSLRLDKLIEFNEHAEYFKNVRKHIEADFGTDN